MSNGIAHEILGFAEIIVGVIEGKNVKLIELWLEIFSNCPTDLAKLEKFQINFNNANEIRK